MIWEGRLPEWVAQRTGFQLCCPYPANDTRVFGELGGEPFPGRPLYEWQHADGKSALMKSRPRVEALVTSPGNTDPDKETRSWQDIM